MQEHKNTFACTKHKNNSIGELYLISIQAIRSNLQISTGKKKHTTNCIYQKKVNNAGALLKRRVKTIIVIVKVSG